MPVQTPDQLIAQRPLGPLSSGEMADVQSEMQKYPGISAEAALGNVRMRQNTAAQGFTPPSQTPQSAGPAPTAFSAAPPAAAAGAQPSIAPGMAGAGTSNASFYSAMQQLLQRGQGLEQIRQQKNSLLTQLYDRALTPDELRTLSPTQQDAIRKGDKSLLELQVMSLNDTLKGRDVANSQALQYLLHGYEIDQAEANRKRDDARASFQMFLQQYGGALGGLTPDEYKSTIGAINSGDWSQISQDTLRKLGDTIRQQQSIAREVKPTPMGQTTDAFGNKITQYGYYDPEQKRFVPIGTPINEGGGIPTGLQPSGGQPRQPGNMLQDFSGATYSTSTYGKDPNWTSAVQNKINTNGQFTSLDQVSQFLKQNNSPITAQMISNASQKYGVSWETLLAVMQHESMLGASNVARSNNNVGGTTWSAGTSVPGASRGSPRPSNEGGYYAKFGNLQAGVNAVAQNLSGRKQDTGQQLVPEKISGVNEDILKAHPDNAAQIVAIAEGRQQGQRAYGKNISPLMTWVNQYDPTYDANRFTFRKDFNDGTMRSNITLGNTGIKHLARFSEEANGLSRADIDFLTSKYNSVQNFLDDQNVNPKFRRLQQDLFAASSEMAGFYAAGAGRASPDESDKLDVRKGLALDGSVGTLQNLTDNAIALIQDKIGTVADNWRAVMRSEPNMDKIILPETKKIMDRLGKRTTGGGASAADILKSVGISP